MAYSGTKFEVAMSNDLGGDAFTITNIWAPGVLGIWGEWLFIFRELGSTGNYFQGFGEQAHSFGNLGSPAIKF